MTNRQNLVLYAARFATKDSLKDNRSLWNANISSIDLAIMSGRSRQATNLHVLSVVQSARPVSATDRTRRHLTVIIKFTLAASRCTDRLLMLR